MKNIIIIGTSHVADTSIKKIKKSFKELMPDIVALELDMNRAYSLKHKTKRPKNFELLKNLGLGGFLFYLFGEYAQKKIGNIVNIEPGSDMLTALELGEKNNCKIALIDRDIKITLRRFSKYFSKKELFKIILDVIFSKKDKIHEIDFSKVPSKEVIKYVLKETKQRYPSLYKVLIDERDKFMAEKIYQISIMNPEKRILIVVGAGHLPGINRYLSKVFG